MVVAITYDAETGNVGQHFGHAKNFKLYEIEDGVIIESAVIQTIGEGHAAVVATLEDYNTSVVICQHMGEHALEGLQANGVAVCPNVEGLADDAIEAFMQGNLQVVAGGANISCGDGGCCGSAGGCGTGCSGCH